MIVWTTPAVEPTRYTRQEHPFHFKVSRSALGTLLALCIATPAIGQVSLGSAQSFAVLGGSTITNTGSTAITGDVGVSPGSAITGFPPGVVTGGTLHAADATASQAQTDLNIAYGAAAGAACTTSLTGQDLGGLTLTPGVYCFSSSAALTGTLTLNLQGNPNAFFLIQIASTLTTASLSSVVLSNTGGPACAPNLFWQVGSSATLGSNSSFQGSILALTSITMTTSAQLSGNALAENGAVTLDTNAISVCNVLTPVTLQEFSVD
ncbi:MAG TPA: ice-binding family protein [Rhodanobacteraceae bacterium]|jgi:type VI secretion system secreted protein VgrG|nr:ice-binding family protein [Rhodanobacteraceae bacterium]